ncbi:glycosyl hydrolase family 25 [Bifidobacterium sp. DSM 109958]|uniref:Glycosyl hydrolase family 25 n=1 Tax=Bifidobacterium moraviense TaxID=2675323 RepID=A0A7Y0F3I7_9BIFI|nr:hypothetical protein [Bifidobacterium sp. DSM 109958]NMN01353.1 glycosyl hydrolase family 25 [Bifidobacterium sp. DSM 109958]
MARRRWAAGAVAAVLTVALGLAATPVGALGADPGYSWNAEDIAWQSAQGGKVLVHRLYSPALGVHHYTADYYEMESLTDAGWTHEGIAFYASASGTPVYRLYNPQTQRHLWTLNEEERDYLVRSAGWNDEQVGWHIDETTQPAMPMYRVYNPDTLEHLWTASPVEYKRLTGRTASATLEQRRVQAQQAVVDARETVGAADRQAAAVQRKVDGLEAELNGLRYSNDLKGYLESVGATTALKAFTDPGFNPDVQYTHLGAWDDATNLDNVIRALELIQECNRLRALTGVRALKVSDTLMAETASSTNWSHRTGTIAHRWVSGWVPNAQNAAWGYANPYDGWYWEEKNNYETGNGGQVGHYFAIAELNDFGPYWVTGLGWVPDGKVAFQDFYWDDMISSNYDSLDRTIPVEQYLDEVRAFKARNEQAGAIQAQLDQARRELADAQAAQRKANDERNAVLTWQAKLEKGENVGF